MENRSVIISRLFFLSVSIAYCFAVFDPDRIRIFFYTAVSISLVGLYIDRSFLVAGMWLPFGLVLYALGHFGWLLWHGKPADVDEAGIYGSYWHVAKYMFWSTPMVCYAINLSKKNERTVSNSVMLKMMVLVSLAVSLLSFREHWIEGFDRVALSFDGGTMASYMMTMVHVLALHQIFIWLHGHKKINILPVSFLLVFIVLQYISILLTGTRAAIIVYPILLSYMLLFASRSIRRPSTFIGAAGVLVLVLALGYNSVIKPRFDSLKNDVITYQIKPDEVTSVGARFSMWDAGWFAAKARPFGERIHDREAVVRQGVQTGALNEQVLGFLKIHLHDDMLEAMSLQGFWGGGLLLVLYASLACQARSSSGSVRMGLTLVLGLIVAFGVGDVLFMWTKLVVLLLLSITLICSAWPGRGAEGEAGKSD
jgi:O-antigen ligase